MKQKRPRAPRCFIRVSPPTLHERVDAKAWAKMTSEIWSGLRDSGLAGSQGRGGTLPSPSEVKSISDRVGTEHPSNPSPQVSGHRAIEDGNLINSGRKEDAIPSVGRSR
jgi:hypothetical protein